MAIQPISGYNGWTNHATWNVAMHINNNEWLYRRAVKFAETEPDGSYQAFIQSNGLAESTTTDGVAWISDQLDYTELDAMMMELVEGE